jgi:hypothetical protein
MTDMMKTLRESLPSADDVLHQVGLEQVHPAPAVLTAMAAFALGAVAGAALAVLFTPRTGRAIRQTLRQRLHTWRQRVATPEIAYSSGAAKHFPESVATPG